MATLVDLVQRTITRLSMVPGPGAQIYAEDRIAEMILHKFVSLRSELYWDDLMTYVTVTQSSSGTPQESIVRVPSTPPDVDEIVINKFTDIQHVWRIGDPTPIPQLPRRINPSVMGPGGYSSYYGPYAQRVIRFYPPQAGQQMVLRYKMHYASFMPDDEVPFDDQALILGACYDYLEDDGMNPSQIEKFLKLFTDRVRQLKQEENDAVIPLTPVFGGATNGYQEIA